MGLLSRAENRTDEIAVSEIASPIVKATDGINSGEAEADLDEMGIALTERIKRLPQGIRTPYAALCLLKAHDSFQVGICLSLADNVYSSYTSVGIGIEKIVIPKEKIWSKERHTDSYFSLDPLALGAENLSINSISEKDFTFWVFPLDQSAKNSEKPWDAVMILGVLNNSGGNSGFDCASVSAIVKSVTAKLTLPLKQDTEPVLSLEEQITQYHRIYADFNCILLDFPGSDGEDKAAFCARVSKMITQSGTVISLSSGRPLILLPAAKDRELIAHRLSKSLGANAVLSFEAKNPENALDRINSFTLND